MKKFILLIITLFSVILMYAQTENNPYNLPLSNEEFFKQSEIVFEGYFIKTVAGYNPKGTEKYADGYRISAYKVQRIYKGTQYSDGDTIYITHPGGRIGMENFTNNSNIYDDGIVYIPGVLSKNGINYAPKLGDPNIYFLISSDFPDDENSKYFSYKKYKRFHNEYMYVCGNIIIGLNDLIFRQRDDFYNYMKQFEGFNVPELTPKIEKKPEPEQAPTKTITIDSLLKDKNLDTIQYKMIKEKWEIKKKALKNLTIQSEYNTLTLQIANQQMVYDAVALKHYVLFDILASTNNPELYFDGTQMRIGYDTMLFGANVIGNEKLTVSFGESFNHPEGYVLYNFSDQYSNGIRVTFGVNIMSPHRTPLDSLPIPLLHFKMEFLPNLVPTSSYFFFLDTTYTTHLSTYALSSNANFLNYYEYDHTFYINSIISTGNSPVITTNFNTISKVAGTGEILTIQGANFGNTQGTGTVYFKVADNGGQTFLKGLDNQYIESWTNTQIDVIVPSYIYKGRNNEMIKSGGAGTGQIKIKTAVGDSCVSTSNLQIPYSVTNAYDSIANKIQRTYLTKKNCDYDFQFILHNYFKTHPLSDTITNIIDKTFRDWSALTGLKMGLEKDSMGNPVTAEWYNIEGKYIIAPRDSGAMATYKSIARVSVDTGNYLYCNASHNSSEASTISINLHPQLNEYPFFWNYDTLSTTIVPYGQANFYQAFMHEVGHILLLDHVNNSSDLMYYSITSGVLIVFPNSTNVAAVQDNIAASRAINWSAAVPSNPPLYPIGVKKPQISILSHTQPILCSGDIMTLSSNYPTGNLWSTGVTTQTIQVSAAGTYTLTIIDGACTQSTSIVITSSTLNASFTVTNVACYGASTGSIITNASGGTAPYTYQWTGNGINTTTPNLYSLPAGTYYLMLSDNIGCTRNYTVSVSQPIQPLTVNVIKSVQFKEPLYHAIVSGGTTPYTYQWSYVLAACKAPPCTLSQFYNSATIPTSCHTNSCTLKVTVTDSNGCVTNSSIAKESKLSVNDETTEILVIPNPTTGSFTISNITDAAVYLYSTLSCLLKTFEHVSYNETINVTNFTA